MNRRGFLGSILAACAAPAIVRADSLMRIVPMDLLVDDNAEAFAEGFASRARIDMLYNDGLQIREWSQYMADHDQTITRYDVRAESKNGVWHQLGVDFRGGETAENRDMARLLLAGQLRDQGLIPLRDKLDLPNGAHFL